MRAELRTLREHDAVEIDDPPTGFPHSLVSSTQHVGRVATAIGGVALERRELRVADRLECDAENRDRRT